MTLSLPGVLAHATTLRDFLQPAGGPTQLVGTSTTVSVASAGPLTPGVIYEFWLVGHNSLRDGPENNYVLHTVAVTP